jgi:hypothetical protein
MKTDGKISRRSITIDSDLDARIQTMSVEQKRSFNKQVEFLLEQAVVRHVTKSLERK